MIILKWHEIHDNGLFILSKFCPQLSTGNQFCQYLELCKVSHTQRSTILERQIQDTGFQLDSYFFPQKKWVFRSGTRAASTTCCDEALGSDPKNPSKSHHHKKQKGFQNTPTASRSTREWPSNNLRQVEFTFYFKKKKKRGGGSTYMRGKWGKQQLSETRFLPFLPTVTNCIWISRALASCHTLAYSMNRTVDQGNIFKVEAQMEIVRYHTQCKFIVHSIIFFLNDVTQQQEGVVVVVVNSY